jgi:hypothetical protein
MAECQRVRGFGPPGWCKGQRSVPRRQLAAVGEPLAGVFYAHPLNPSAKSRTVRRVSVSQYIPRCGVPREGLRNLVGQPHLRKILGDAEMNDFSPLMVKHDQGIQDPKRRGCDDEHVYRHGSLALADLGSVCEGIFHTVPDMARNFDTISVRPGHEGNLMRPYFAAHGRDGVAEGQDCFWIPGGGSRLELS